MAISLSHHQYGKAETRLVRLVRDTARHEIHDLNVSTTLRGDFDAAYLVGDQSAVLPTDSQKNTVYAFAQRYGIETVEAFGLRLARHFVADVGPVRAARVEIEQFAWTRALVGGAEHDHTWVRAGAEVRTAAVTVRAGGNRPGDGGGAGAHVVAGLKDLVLLKSTGSEFAGFRTDPYTTLVPTHDRIMATSLTARWRFTRTDVAWDQVYAGVRAILVEQFATLHSLALQQTLWHMGRAVLEAYPGIAEIRLSAPNKHHFLVDLDPFGLDNPGEVFHADDRPYGLIEATISRDDEDGDDGRGDDGRGDDGAAEAWLPGPGLA